MAVEIEGSAFEFPCEIPIKAMGRASARFHDTVVELIGAHVPVDLTRVTRRESGAGRYISITVPVEFASREQMERVYRDLGEHEDVLWTL